MDYTRTQALALAALSLAVLIACASIARAGIAHADRAPFCDPYTVECDSAADCAAKARCP